jgi:hypothetical protein
MTESGPATLRDIVTFQLTLLDLYETLLENLTWDEERLNTTLKTFMLSVLALTRVQRGLGDRVAAVQKEAIREYRGRLEAWLREHDGTGDGPRSPHGDTAPPSGQGIPL